MWRMSLLSQVIPAFGALAQSFIDNDKHSSVNVSLDAATVYACIDNIGAALYKSQGRMAPNLDEAILNELLWALNSRLPPRGDGLSSRVPLTVCPVLCSIGVVYIQ